MGTTTERVQLVSAGLSENYIRSPRTGVYPPLNLACLAASLRASRPDAEIELFDGEIMSHDEISRRLDAPVVGISCNVMTYKSGLSLAESAAGKGCRVLLGGPYPTAFAERILKRRPFVDAISVGDGEATLDGYVGGSPYASIPNLCYRRENDFVENARHDLVLDDLPFADYLNLPLDFYFQRFTGRYGAFKPIEKSLAIYSRKGCIWRDRSHGGCVFCMIPHDGVRYKSATRLWSEIRFFHETRGVKHFWEVSDTFTENSRWLEEFVASRPSDLDISFNVYGRTSNITRSMARQLKDLGVHEVFLGIESGDDAVLSLANKGTNVDQSRRAVEHLAACDVRAVASFVLGLPGETGRSLQKTLSLARELLAFGNIVETSTSIMLPIPGSRAFSMLSAQPDLCGKYSGDLFDLEELKHDWIMRFTRTSPDEPECALRETMTMFPLNDSFSQVATQSAPMC